MIRKGIHFTHAPSLRDSYTLWGDTEEIEDNGETKRVWKDIRYTGERHDGERIETNYCVPIRLYRKRPNKRARAVELMCRDGEKRTFYTLPEPISGHSRTNMAYGTTKYHKDGSESSKTYWFENGCVYSTSSRFTPESPLHALARQAT